VAGRGTAMKNQIKWGVGFIIFGLFMLFLIDYAVEHEEKEIGIPVLKLLYGVSFILIGLAVILFKNREEKIEKIKENP